MIRVVIPGPPRSWQRPKGHGGGYAPAVNADHLRTLEQYIWEAARGSGIVPGSPIEVRCYFIFDGRDGGETIVEILPAKAVGPFGYGWRDKIPDLDNLTKLVMEALAPAGVVSDDKQVVRTIAEKVDRRR